jgi:glutamine transport system permease protein
MAIFNILVENLDVFLVALGNTLKMTGLSLLLATLVGLFVSLLSLSRFKLLRAMGKIYVDLLRGVPMIVLVMFVYFGLPQGLQSIGFTNFRFKVFTAGVIALSLNAGAYMSEIIRGGILAVDSGQREAALSLGLSGTMVMGNVVLPQAFRIMVPSIINQFIISLKDTSIISVISFAEIVRTGQIIIARSASYTLQVWTVVGLLYLVIIIPLSYAGRYLEKRLKYE